MKQLALFLLACIAAPAAAQENAELAREAAALAAAAPESEAREAALRSVAIALRSSHPELAREAAGRMTRPVDLQAFEELPDRLAAQARATAAERDRCTGLLEAGHRAAELEARVVVCGMTEHHPRMLPPIATLLRYADALPSGDVRLRILLHAFVLSAGPQTAHRSVVAERVRALRPHLAGASRDEADAFLDSPDMHIAEGRPSEALAVALRSGDRLLLQLVTASLVRNGDTDVALQAAAAWPRNAGCPLEGAPFLTTGSWTDEQRRNLASFVDRLPDAPFYRSACPDGIGTVTLAELQLTTDRLEAAAASLQGVDPDQAARIGLMIAQRYRALGQAEQARALLLVLASRSPGFEASAGRAPIAPFNLRFRIIMTLAALGESAEATRLARDFTHPAWRAAALAAVASGASSADPPDLPPLY